MRNQAHDRLSNRLIRSTVTYGPALEAEVHKPETNDLFGIHVYQRGALMLHALRVEVGDDLFFEILQTWVQRFSGQSVTTADFESLSEEVSGQELTTLFDQWIRTTEMPVELAGVKLGAEDRSDFITLVAEQTNAFRLTRARPQE